MIPRRVAVILLAAVLTGGTVAYAQSDESPDLVWHDIEDALAQAGPEDKKILIDFYTDWCGWCKRMDKTTYGDSIVISYINQHFIPVKLNPEHNDSLEYDGDVYTYRELARAMSVRGYPATGFLNENQEMLTLISGYHDASRFLSFLQFFGGDHHLTSDYQTWMAGDSGGEANAGDSSSDE